MATPAVTSLLVSLIDLCAELTGDIDRLTKRLNQPDTCLKLSTARYNIVDREEDRKRLRRRWKVTLGELVSEEIESELLTEALPSVPLTPEESGCSSDGVLPQTKRKGGGIRSRVE